jgi:hypothetical protein
MALAYAHPRGEDPNRELLLYIVHGVLHLIGYDDLEPQRRRAMRAMERRCMRHLEEGDSPWRGESSHPPAVVNEAGAGAHSVCVTTPLSHLDQR